MRPTQSPAGLDEVDLLRAENASLRDRLRRLDAEVNSLRLHPALAQGMKGERLIATMTGGRLTSRNAAHDIVVEGARIEVKMSKLNRPHRAYEIRRWNWSKPLGWQDKGKDADWLLLVGHTDNRYADQYKSPTSAYVFFLIPFAQVHEVMTLGGSIGGSIQLNTNLAKARTKASKRLCDFQVAEDDVVNLRLTVRRPSCAVDLSAPSARKV